MDIAVVIPTFNRRTTLPRAIDSVLSQTCPPREIIVVDDGSTDGSTQLIVEAYPSVEYHYQPNQGVSAARNLGVRLCSSHWIALLDSDDEWAANKLERQMLALDSRQSARIIHSDERWFRNGHPLNQKKHHRKSGGDIFAVSLERCMISPSAVLIARSIFDDYGFFDESLPACEDYDLWLRVTAFEPVAFVDEPLVNKYGGHPDQLSKTIASLDQYRVRSLAKLLAQKNLHPEKRRLAEGTLKRKAEIFAQGAEKRGHDEQARAMRALMSRTLGARP